MATNKFFTWTKGERKHASSSFVPIPAECITIRGLEYSRNAKGSSKANRKPLPLDFDQPPTTRSSQSSRAHDSIALQDAAVQSATSLMNVVSDMLKSPQLSAHLLSTQQSSAGLQPMQGRPRSRTAPSTPMFEAPNMEPVELPGSTPPWHQPHGPFLDTKSTRVTTLPDHVALGRSIERPHSSPQESTYKNPIYPRQSSDSFSHSVVSLLPSADATPRRDRSSSHLSPRALPTPTATDIDEHIRRTTMMNTSRPSLEIQQSRHKKSTSISGSLVSSRNGSTQSIPRGDTELPKYKALPTDPDIASTDVNIMMDQITAMRSAHEAHVSSLKESHEREIDSHRAYITLLERRHSVARSLDEDAKQSLTLDTSRTAGRASRLSNDASSATTSVQSFEASFENQKRTSAEALAELEALKRKLSLSLKAQAQLGGVRRERDHLKDATERSDKRILQLKDIIRKGKDGEKVSKDKLAALEAALETANMARTDALEGFYEACEQVRRLSDWQKIMAKERNELRRKLHEATMGRSVSAPPIEPEHNPSNEILEHKRATLRDDPLVQQLDDLRLLVAEKDSRIQQLEQASDHRHHLPNTDSDHASLKEQLKTCTVQLNQARSDRDRFDELLHSELRRQSKAAAQKAHAVTPQVEQEASRTLSDRMRRISPHPPSTNTLDPQPDSSAIKANLLEQELKHCIQEIIMFKLDVKGYKKDLKAANSKISILEEAQRPATPDSRSGRDRAASRAQELNSTGLGISLLRHQRQISNTSVANATMNALLSTTPTPTPQPASSSPPFRPKTPLGAHKKLPKPPPPPQTPSPRMNPVPSPPKIQRHETLRSLSESIISSYAKRGGNTPEMQPTPPPPPRMKGGEQQADVAVAMPIAKYSAEMLKMAEKVL